MEKWTAFLKILMLFSVELIFKYKSLNNDTNIEPIRLPYFERIHGQNFYELQNDESN